MGALMGTQKKILWIEVSTTNNDPAVIAHYYLKAIEKFRFLPTVIRTDHGAEATLLEELQMALRHLHSDEYSGLKSFIRGKSTRNQRIEAYWRQFRQHMEDFYINLFKTMEHENLINVSNPLHIECLRYCFAELIKEDISLARREWNEHRIRKQKNRNASGGIPNLLFKCPGKFEASDFKKAVNLDHVKLPLEKYANEPMLVSPDFKEMADVLLNMPQKPSTPEDAYNLYIKLFDIMEQIGNPI